MIWVVVFALIVLCGGLLYVIGLIDERHVKERQELQSRIDALVTSLARERGIPLDMPPRKREVEQSAGWFDGKPVVLVKSEE